jgi:transcriptional regulator with XRE-family HTH domain
MTLRDYLWKSSITQATFAERSGIDPAALSRIVNEKQPVGVIRALQILAASNGKVTLDDLTLHKGVAELISAALGVA